MKLRRNQQGTTYVEVLLAGAILAITGAGLLNLYLVGTTAEADSRARQVALSLADDRLESLRGEPLPAVGTERDDSLDAHPGFWRQVEVADPGAGLRRVTVTVGWQADGRSHTVTVSTLLAGPYDGS